MHPEIYAVYVSNGIYYLLFYFLIINYFLMSYRLLVRVPGSVYIEMPEYRKRNGNKYFKIRTLL